MNTSVSVADSTNLISCDRGRLAGRADLSFGIDRQPAAATFVDGRGGIAQSEPITESEEGHICHTAGELLNSDQLFIPLLLGISSD